MCIYMYVFDNEKIIFFLIARNLDEILEMKIPCDTSNKIYGTNC